VCGCTLNKKSQRVSAKNLKLIPRQRLFNGKPVISGIEEICNIDLLELTGILEVQTSVIEISINRESTGLLFQELARREGIGEINYARGKR
jgi:hypothetical protein